jgi:hypothetical protein
MGFGFKLNPRAFSVWNASANSLYFIVKWQMAQYNRGQFGTGHPTENARIVPLGHCEHN